MTVTAAPTTTRESLLSEVATFADLLRIAEEEHAAALARLAAFDGTGCRWTCCACSGEFDGVDPGLVTEEGDVCRSCVRGTHGAPVPAALSVWVARLTPTKMERARALVAWHRGLGPAVEPDGRAWVASLDAKVARLWAAGQR